MRKNIPVNKDLSGQIFAPTNYFDLTNTEQGRILQFQQEILQLVVLGNDYKEICEKVCLLMEQLLDNAVASVMLLDKEKQCMNVFAAPSVPEACIVQLNGLRPGPGAGSCGNAVFHQEPVFVESTLDDPRWQNIRQLAIDFNILSCWSMPVRSKGGECIGSFALSSFEHRLPSTFHRKLLEIGSFIIGIALEQKKVNEQLYLSSKVFENSTEAIMIADANKIIISINKALYKITGYVDEEIVGKSVTIVTSIRHGSNFFQKIWQSVKQHNHWYGEIWNRHKQGREYPAWFNVIPVRSKDGRISYYLINFSDITSKKKSDEIIWRQANYDSLTGLPNRNMFYDRLNHDIKNAARIGAGLAVLFIDLDRFKEVNDSLGHSVGDALLAEAAKRLSSCVRETDTVARLGGDEFTIILNGISEQRSAEKIMQMILMELAKPFHLNTKQAYVSASIGATFFPDDANNVEILMKNADQAMYAAKNNGRNCWSCFTSNMRAATEIRSRTAYELRSALRDQQLYLLYQPIVELATGNVYKAEALIRWQHPERGTVYPGEFISIAEETNLITDIGDWVFKQAVNQVALWQTNFNAGFQISINKSPKQFISKMSDWVNHLNERGLDGQSIIVEITENLLLDVHELVVKQLLNYRDAGVQVAIDDFGTGYSSLSYLKKFDIDYLKIDRSFISNLDSKSNDRILCEAVITMAHRLGMKVIAEGVETDLQKELLTSMGCDFGQGNFFSKPVTADKFETLLLQ
ncbi:PAS domain S-box-containing protein/diguanylate cyclase (GGDEF)-like protein [Nitrosomonas oligotropha]|uniref:PAS domain S-box-containing protein/diguanylate cyclase (GGDEF)-like protein n=1 Tax=Nitrosomonas oligotropha TaxID=42354 RepID=A0A2T5HDW8_9PROT|nr:EAL domain-containing protein [Nitrosomonas oligotropha]PTQ69783.1 PAS domain S-box-containing protein/diguanylate cyclase (GGDEF)-like protein [Nitrosomonas oligotropha]